MNKKFKVTFRGNEIVEFDEGTTYKGVSVGKRTMGGSWATQGPVTLGNHFYL